MYSMKRPMEDWEKLTLGLVIVVILLFFFLLMKDRVRPIKNFPSTNNGGIVVFGDSLAEGVGSTSGEGFVGPLENRINETIINEGVSGDTTADGLARISDVIRHDAEIVIISLGGNDALQSVPLETTEQNMNRIISQIQNNGSVVILLGVRSGIFNDSYKSMYRDLATLHQTALVPNILSGLFGDTRFMADAVHPNDSGYERIADRIFPVLLELNQ